MLLLLLEWAVWAVGVAGVATLAWRGGAALLSYLTVHATENTTSLPSTYGPWAGSRVEGAFSSSC